MTSIWKEDKNTNNDDLFLEIESFFDHIEDCGHLQYRDGQRSMAYSVVDAIKNKQILLIEAGVGIGKSYAYLIPIIQSIKDSEKFEGAIIATSTIALQEQLMKDVEDVSKMLGLDSIDVVLAKGKNNYICRKRLNNFLKTSNNEKYQYILDEVLKNDTIDRKDFEEISDKVWRDLNVRNCSSMACPYYLDCKIAQERSTYKNAKVVITNQDLLIHDMKRSEGDHLFLGDKVVVVDEAHNLEDKIRTSYVIALDKRYIESLFFRLYTSVSDYTENCLPPQELFTKLSEFFTRLRSSAKSEISKVDGKVNSYADCSRIRFNCNKKLEEIINNLITVTESIFNEINYKNSVGNYNIDKKALEELKNFKMILQDILMKEKSKNIYWVDFIDNEGKYLRLTYAPKKIDELSASLLSKNRAGIVLTSATLSAGDEDYSYYSSSIGLDKVVGKSVLKDFPQMSPYDYDNNTILYCPQDIAPPTNKKQYLFDIVDRIKELIEVTNGRTLVLFTSKNDMNYVYECINKENFDFPIYVQKDNVDVKKIKEDFEQNVSSCLFATGSFFEGIDVKGESLSQVIMAKLPFPVVDPVIDYRADQYRDGFLKVYLPEMISKLKQGTGRAIRSENDKAVISILDSRIYGYNIKYDNLIFNSLPYSNITDDINEVRSFVKEKLK